MRDAPAWEATFRTDPVLTVSPFQPEWGWALVRAAWFAEIVPNLLYLEALGRADSTSDSEIARYRRVWEHLTALALSPRESRERIERYVARDTLTLARIASVSAVSASSTI